MTTFQDITNQTSGVEPFSITKMDDDSRSSIKEGDVLCFEDEEHAEFGFNIFSHKPGDCPVISCFLNEEVGKSVKVPINLLYFGHEGESLILQSKDRDLERIRHMLGKCWTVSAIKKVVVHYDRYVGYDESPYGYTYASWEEWKDGHKYDLLDDWRADETWEEISKRMHCIEKTTVSQIYILSPTDHETLVRWLYKQDEVYYDREAAAVLWPIKLKYRQLKEQNTKTVRTLLSTETCNVRDHSYFTWGEGTKEFQTWTVVEKWKVETWYKGEFVSSEIRYESHEERD